jgi:Ca2+-binding RTX toxin-like protein
MSFAHWLAGLTGKLPARPRSRPSFGKHRRTTPSAAKASEYLEQRILLAAASVAGTTLSVIDSGTEANAVTLSLSGSNLLINDSANPLTAGAGATVVDANTVSVLLSSVTDATFTLGDNNDSFTIDFATGSPLLNGGITYDGGADSGGGDSLSLTNVGSSFPTHTYDYTNVNDGSITLNDGATDFAVTYVGLEPITNDGTATDIVFNLPMGNNGDVVLQDSASGIVGSMELSGSTFANTTFSASGATTLTVNGNTGDDVITVNGVDGAFTGTITLNGMDGADTVDASASTIGVTIDGGDGADTITGSDFVDSLSGGLGADTIRGEDATSVTGGADTIFGGLVNPVVIFQTNFGDIAIELFEDLAPNTVASFLNYVNDGDYINSFIHRSLPGFVIQGGGFTTSTTTFVQGTTVVSNVPTDPPILNEGNGVGDRSNVRGTLCTAQQGGDINTFTSQWFVNLVDNLALDGVPHVVFGAVLDMTVPDLIASIATVSLVTETGNGALTNVPLTDTAASGNGDFVVVNSVTVTNVSAGIDDGDVIFGAIGADTIYGGDGNDTLMGDDDADSLFGGDGDDDVNGNNGKDTIHGSDGSDTLMGGADDDSMFGGDGDDVVNGNSGNDIQFGSDGNDTLFGGSEADTLFGEAGNDMVFGQGASDDVVSGGTGDDLIDGGPGPSTLVESADGDFDLDSSAVPGEGTLVGSVTGTDMLVGIEQAQLTGGGSANVINVSDFDGPTTIDGGDGNDVLTGGDGGATITGGTGTDRITGGTAADDLRGGDGNDTLAGGDGQDTLFGDADDDLINGGGDADTLNGSAGSDTLEGDGGDDVLNGNGGSGDILTGGAGNDTLDGGDGEDRVLETADTDFVLADNSLTSVATGTDALTSIEGGILNGGAAANSIDASAFSGTSEINGGGGDDILLGSAQASMLEGAAGNDSITGGAQNDIISGGTENDTINGADGDDSINGGDNDDLINGGLGADTISGDDGNDRLIGVSNADVTAAVTDLAILNTTNGDSIDGGAGNDTIVGGLGADAVNGGDGLDIIDVASGGDTTTGLDSVTSSIGGDLVFADPEDIIIAIP